MAMTATITTNPASTAVTEQKVTAILVISNSSSQPVYVTAIDPFTILTGGATATTSTNASTGVVNMGPNTNVTVPGNGSLTFTWDLVFHGPSSGYLSTGAGTYSVGATCYTSDGSVFQPTAGTLTVNYVVTYNASQS